MRALKPTVGAWVESLLGELRRTSHAAWPNKKENISRGKRYVRPRKTSNKLQFMYLTLILKKVFKIMWFLF